MDFESTPASGRRMLVATNHLSNIAGSEVVALEAARHFAALGCTITVFANFAAEPMAGLMRAATGGPPVLDPAAIRPFTYDMVYVQHQVLGLFDYRPSPDDRAATRIVTGRLSRRSFLESGGWLHDRVLVDHVLANSVLTAEHLASAGHDGPITPFLNAAPAEFFRPFQPRPPAPRNVLVVTSHRDPALMEAIAILRTSIPVRHVGRRGDMVTLVTPQMIADADLVISIGKTIPYALAARVPVYVYDHFGGPGYLDGDNLALAERYNFTGRCCERKLSGTGIAAEILRDYDKGGAFARDAPDDWLQRFCLPRYLDLLLAPATASNAEKQARMAASPFLVQERLLAEYVRDSYRSSRAQMRQIRRLSKAR